MKKVLTLCIIHQDSRVLLGMKKRGFGAGWWNGFGGKVIPGETIEDATKRELLEEACIKVTDLEKIGILEFEFRGNPEILEVHLFKSTTFTGEPAETEEMKPAWYDIDQIPFDKMWPDDQYWMPYFLAGKKFKARFLFDEAHVILQKEITEVEKI